jgi:hypothetical protein
VPDIDPQAIDQGQADPAPRRGFHPTDEPWGDYYRQMFPHHERPESAFAVWKYATTAVDVASVCWDARERARVEWGNHYGNDPIGWPVQHPPVVLYIPQVSWVGCLRCCWVARGGGADVENAANLGRGHAVEHGSCEQTMAGAPVFVSARSGLLTTLTPTTVHTSAPG